MKRRSLFKLFSGAVAASAMQVCGWRLPRRRFSDINDILARDASRIVSELFTLARSKSRFTELIQNGKIPDGMGYNYKSILYTRQSTEHKQES